MSSKLDQALASLNPAQKEAATFIDGAMLILAGAGSGKTKTLTTRLAYLIDAVGIDPLSTLTLTFTNKAAAEMRERALNLLSTDSNFGGEIHTRPSRKTPLLATFHRFGRLFLERYITALNRANNFIIMDSDDKKSLISELNRHKDIKHKEIGDYISECKEQALSPAESAAFAKHPEFKKMNEIYALYEQILIQNNRVDFDDLLYLPYKIMRDFEHIRHGVSERFSYIMVDEYQDTNELQYRLLRQLTSTHQNIAVVGDDDQSIYGWRGAKIENILNFSKQFSDVKVIKLEQNYRSTRQILEAANNLISHNKSRLGKNLSSQIGDGKAVVIKKFYDEKFEVNFIADEIFALTKMGENPNEIAVLFRTNALSRSLEDGLNKRGIPYRLIGAIRFYERAEIKDLICYLRLALNLHDDVSLRRIINKPKRGIGEVSENSIFNAARAQNLSVYSAFRAGIFNALSPKIYTALDDLFSILERLNLAENLSEICEILGKNLDIPSAYFKIDTHEYTEKMENVEEFLGQLKDFQQKQESELENDNFGAEFLEDSVEESLVDSTQLTAKKTHEMLFEFLNDLSLESALDAEIKGEINCMNVHNAKGLEFSSVFVMGFEEGLFPILSDDLEEERRLGYVAFTRAKKRLYISHVESRFYRGERKNALPSRFIKEAKINSENKESFENFETEIDADSNFVKGKLVSHKIFGTGRILKVEQNGNDEILTINFGGLNKRILSSFVVLVDG